MSSVFMPMDSNVFANRLQNALLERLIIVTVENSHLWQMANLIEHRGVGFEYDDEKARQYENDDQGT